MKRIGIPNAILAPAPPEHNPQKHLRSPRRDSLAALGTALGVVFTPRRRQIMSEG